MDGTATREHLRRIKAGIAAGTFNFADEFPDFRGLHKLPLSLRAQTCSDVFDAFLRHEETRVTKGDLAPATLASHRQSLEAIREAMGYVTPKPADAPVARPLPSPFGSGFASSGTPGRVKYRKGGGK